MRTVMRKRTPVVIGLLAAVTFFCSASLRGGDQVDDLQFTTPEARLQDLGFGLNSADLIRAMKSPDSQARLLAVKVIARGNHQGLDAPLESLLDDQAHSVRLEAAQALAKKGHDRARAVLRAFLEYELQGTHTMVQKIRAAGTLADLGDCRGFELVKSALLEDHPTGLKVIAARALPKFSKFKPEGIDIVPLLIKAADEVLRNIADKINRGEKKEFDADNILFIWIANGLQETGDERALSKLNEAIQHQDSSVRLAAERAHDGIQKRLRGAK